VARVSQDKLDSTDPPRLARILGVSEVTPDILSDQELATILEHQLRTPLMVDVTDTDAQITFGELLTAQNPRLDLLDRVRRFAKACKIHPDGPLPAEVGTVLYLASILKALVACGERISALGDAELSGGVHWALQQAWVSGPVRQLLEAGVAHVSLGEQDAGDGPA
jgi:hypothetical protein